MNDVFSFISDYETVQVIMAVGVFLAIPALFYSRKLASDNAKFKAQADERARELINTQNRVAEDESRRRTAWHNLTTKPTLIEAPHKTK